MKLGTRARAALAVAGLSAAAVSLIAPGLATAGEEGPAPAPKAQTAPPIQSWTVTGTGSPTAMYIQDPALPIPADPAIEFTTGYTSIFFDSGPSARALSSTAWPGPLAGDGLSAVDSNIPAYGVRAEQNYPSDEGNPPAEFGPPQATPYMYAEATATYARAISRGGNTQLVDQANPVYSVGSAASESFVEVIGDERVRSITVATASDINFLGLITIDSVRSEAEVFSDGVSGTTRTKTEFSGVEAAGFPAEIGPDGFELIDTGAPIDEILAPLKDGLDQLEGLLPPSAYDEIAGALGGSNPLSNESKQDGSGDSGGGGGGSGDRFAVRQALDIVEAQINGFIGEIGVEIFTAPPNESVEGAQATASTGGVVIVLDTFRGAQIRDGSGIDFNSLIFTLPEPPSFNSNQPNVQGSLLAASQLSSTITYVFGGASAQAEARPPFEFSFNFDPGFLAPSPQLPSIPTPVTDGFVPGFGTARPTQTQGVPGLDPSIPAPVVQPAGNATTYVPGIALGAGLVLLAMFGSSWFGAAMRKLPTDIFAGAAASSCPPYREGYDWSDVDGETSGTQRSILHPF